MLLPLTAVGSCGVGCGLLLHPERMACAQERRKVLPKLKA